MSIEEFAAVAAPRPPKEFLILQSLADWRAKLAALRQELRDLAGNPSAEAGRRRDAIAQEARRAKAAIAALAAPQRKAAR